MIVVGCVSCKYSDISTKCNFQFMCPLLSQMAVCTTPMAAIGGPVVGTFLKLCSVYQDALNHYSTIQNNLSDIMSKMSCEWRKG